LYIVNVRVIVF